MKKYTAPEMKALAFVAEEAISAGGNLGMSYNDGSFAAGSWGNNTDGGQMN